MGMGIAPIPRASITDFIRENGIEDGQTFRALIRRLDSLFMAHHAPKD